MAISPCPPSPARRDRLATLAIGLVLAILALLLAGIGWRCAIALDSALLGFCSAMLAMIVGVSAYGVVHAPQRKGY